MGTTWQTSRSDGRKGGGGRPGAKGAIHDYAADDVSHQSIKEAGGGEGGEPGPFKARENEGGTY